MKHKSFIQILLTGIVLFAMLILSVSTPRTVAASSPPPTPENLTGKFVINPSIVPFVWLRSYPSSDAPVIITLYPPSGLVASVSLSKETVYWDGIQWWFYVNRIGTPVTGWVELASLGRTTIVAPTVRPPNVEAWTTASAVKVKSRISFVWLRAAPDSTAGVLSTVGSAGLLKVVSNNPSFDTQQWWWQVSVPNTQITGWVEQSSLAAQPYTGPTETPAPTYPPEQFHEYQYQAAFQSYERGFMIWLSESETIYVFVNAPAPNRNAVWSEYDKSNYGSLPDNPISEVPPSGRIKPIRGFGKVWGNFKTVRDDLGWATSSEQAYTSTATYPLAMLRFFLLTLPNNRVIKATQPSASPAWYWYFCTQNCKS